MYLHKYDIFVVIAIPKTARLLSVEIARIRSHIPPDRIVVSVNFAFV